MTTTLSDAHTNYLVAHRRFHDAMHDAVSRHPLMAGGRTGIYETRHDGRFEVSPRRAAYLAWRSSGHAKKLYAEMVRAHADLKRAFHGPVAE